MPSVLHPYAGVNLDRAGRLRKDPAWVAAQLAERKARAIPIWRNRSPIVEGEGTARAAVLPADGWWSDIPDSEVALLGLVGDAPVFAVDVSPLDSPDQHPKLSRAGEFADLRTVATRLDGTEAALLGYARGLMGWHRRVRFCSVCGSPTISAEGGHVRKCANPDCGTHHFPRTDPAVIMLIHDDDRVLLARAPHFPPGMHSILAGFVEPGESLEEAVERETFEETGVSITDIRYHSSQPWPFPGSIMVGFTARAVTKDLTVDTDELVDAVWYERDWLRTVQENEDFRLPRRDSIAWRLIEGWINGSLA